MVLATSGPEGLDCSPRGDPAGFVHVLDDKTLLIPDRRGNNRIDSLRNIIRDDRVALLFLIPGVGETLRVNGRASISVAPELIGRFPFRGTLPRSVIVVGRRASISNARRRWSGRNCGTPTSTSAANLPSTGTILADITAGRSAASNTTVTTPNACARRSIERTRREGHGPLSNPTPRMVGSDNRRRSR